ncbi:hypothetical protein [Halomarina pelagica]|uniref:hypothetical protein n=1 Tax=Halomarina pelagica TaxID=2961599 RepID=UPI0020C4970E|nr:hypothetical protein [Halomarina sp. BND7]
MYLTVLAVDGRCRLADALWVLRGDGLDEFEIRRPHEAADVVELFEVQDETDVLLDRLASLASFGAAESLAGCVIAHARPCDDSRYVAVLRFGCQ